MRARSPWVPVLVVGLLTSGVACITAAEDDPFATMPEAKPGSESSNREDDVTSEKPESKGSKGLEEEEVGEPSEEEATEEGVDGGASQGSGASAKDASAKKDAATKTDSGTTPDSSVRDSGSTPADTGAPKPDAKPPVVRKGVCAATTTYASCRHCCAKQADSVLWETTFRAEMCKTERCGQVCNTGGFFTWDYCDDPNVPTPAANTPCGYCLTNENWSSFARTAATVECGLNPACKVPFESCTKIDAKCSELLDD